MKFIQFLATQTKKYLKGLTTIALIWLFLSFGVFIFESCKKANYENSKSGEAAKKFIATLDETKSKLSLVDIGSRNVYQARISNPDGIYYVDFPSETNPEIISNFENNANIQTLTEVLQFHSAAINDTLNPNYDISIIIPEQQIETALQPLVAEAKNYLIAKGITHQQITDMIQEEGAAEIDLIPFVKTLIAVEESQYTIGKISLPFVTEASAMNRFLECGLAAIGGDALYALSQSSASAWTWSTMKSVFKNVAKKFLGPIGVAVAVVSFGVCMLQ